MAREHPGYHSVREWCLHDGLDLGSEAAREEVFQRGWVQHLELVPDGHGPIGRDGLGLLGLVLHNFDVFRAHLALDSGLL